MKHFKFGNGNKSFVILPGLSVHGIMSFADSIAEAYAEFSKEYTVYVFDRTDDISEGCTIKSMSDDTAKAMRTLNIEKADVFGASQGGMIAMRLAAEYPELVGKLILASTLAEKNDTFTGVIGEWIRLAEEKNEEKLIDSFISNVYSERTVNACRDILISSLLPIGDDDFRRFVLSAKACLSFDFHEKLPLIHKDALVIGSEGDRVASEYGSRQIADALGCEIYIYDKTYGHAVYDEAPDFKQRCLDFLRK